MFAHDAVPVVFPVCGPTKEPLAYDALIDDDANDALVAVIAEVTLPSKRLAVAAYEAD